MDASGARSQDVPGRADRVGLLHRRPLAQNPLVTAETPARAFAGDGLPALMMADQRKEV